VYTLIYNILALNKVFNVHNYVELGAGKVRTRRACTPWGDCDPGLKTCCMLDTDNMFQVDAAAAIVISPYPELSEGLSHSGGCFASCEPPSN